MIFLMVGIVSAADYYVDPTGDDGNACTASGASACLTIQAAIGKASATDTVNVAAGTYNEAITINKALTLNGAQAGNDARTRTGDETIIRPTTNVEAAVYITADGVTIDGFEINGTTVCTTGILGWETSGLTIKNNKVHGAIRAWHGVGILLFSWGNGGTVYDNTIQNNVVYDTGRMGIMVMDYDGSSYTLTTNNVISNNEVYDTWKVTWGDHGGAIQFNVGKDISITGNEIYNTQNGQRGIYVFGSASGNVISGNDIHDNPIGIQIWPDGIMPNGSSGTPIVWGSETAISPTISNNKIYSNLEGAKIYNGPLFGSLLAEYNWWGTNNGSVIATMVEGNVDYDPWDDDGILNGEDRCPGTVADVPEKRLGTNRWMWNGEEWITKSPNGVGPDFTVTMEDTHGCSCDQILDEMGYGEKTGHRKFGCSKSVLEDFIASIQLPIFVETVEVPSDGSSVTSTNVLGSGVTYLLEASGTYSFANWGLYGIADAEWAYRNDGYSDPNPFGWTLGEDTYPSVLGLDVLVNGGNVYWGDYNSAHNYVLSYTGNGNPVSFDIYDSHYSDNSGFITVDIYELP